MHVDTSMAAGDAEFPETAWSLVLRARDPADPACREHLGRLIQRYWRPAYRYIRARGQVTVEDAKDLTQAFFARLVEKEHLARLDPGRGSFRGFIKRSLANFIIDSYRHEASRRPQAGKQMFAFDETIDEPISEEGDAGELFERSWNESVLRAALDALKDGLSDRPGYHDVFAAYSLVDASERPSYAQLAERFALTEGQVWKRLAFCRQMLSRELREQVEQYVLDPAEVEAELKSILHG